jgi:LysM repeat protein
MGNYWLHGVVPILQEAFGPELQLLSGYETRSRSTGGFEAIRGIIWHHDADPPTGSDDSVVQYEYFNAADKPIGNFHVKRNGVVVMGAAGASNHAGKGGPLTTTKGSVPLNQGNLYLIGVEFSNSGVGEPWPQKQVDNGIKLFSILCKFYGLKPETDVYGHYDYCMPSCPGRKVDPAGPVPAYPQLGGTTGRTTWKVAELRKLIKSKMTNTVPPTGTVGKYTVKSGDSWWSIAQAYKTTMQILWQMNPPATADTVIHPGEVVFVPGTGAGTGGWVQPPHTQKYVPGGMDNLPTWGTANETNVRWLQQFFAEQAWWTGKVDGVWSVAFQAAVAFVQRTFKDWKPPKSPNSLTKTDGLWYQETALKIDEWARQQPWYNSI